MLKKFLVVPTLILGLGTGFTVFADDTSAPTDTSAAQVQSPTSGSGSCNWKQKWQAMVQTLQLDQDQQAKIKAIRESAKATMKGSWEQLKTIRQQMKSMVTSDNLDQSQLDALIQQKSALMNTLLKTKITMQNQIYNVLNPQQKQQFQTMMDTWEANKKSGQGC